VACRWRAASMASSSRGAGLMRAAIRAIWPSPSGRRVRRCVVSFSLAMGEASLEAGFLDGATRRGGRRLGGLPGGVGARLSGGREGAWRRSCYVVSGICGVRSKITSSRVTWLWLATMTVEQLRI